jgi:hypothetical protein
MSAKNELANVHHTRYIQIVKEMKEGIGKKTLQQLQG